jgi:chaperonin GroEL (HSP60 family)
MEDSMLVKGVIIDKDFSHPQMPKVSDGRNAGSQSCNSDCRVARFLLERDTKAGKKCTSSTQNVSHGHKISKMSLKYS